MLNIVAFILIISGLFFSVSSVLGLLKFSDFYTKIHVMSISDSFGNILILLGLALLQTSIVNSYKIILMILLMWLLGPVSTHAIAKAYWIRYKKDA
jgi:multicomponent Na+:H+ antiporter subunit G